MKTKTRVTWLNIVLALLIAALLLPPSTVKAAVVIYVDDSAVTGANNGTSWADAYTSLQTALDDAERGDDIWVAAGTYTPGSARADSFVLKNGVSIYGGFAGSETALSERVWAANPSILSGDIGTIGDNSDNAYHVVYGSGLATSAELDGFTITGGNANGSSPNNAGGGMYMTGSRPALTNLIFSGNSAVNGGGMYMGSSSDLNLTNTLFIGNTATGTGGGVAIYASSPNMVNIAFSGNSAANGGGLHNSNARINIDHATFSGNSAVKGGGISCEWACDIFFYGSILWGNTAPNGAQFHLYNGGFGGGINIVQGDSDFLNADPLFVDADGADNIFGTADDNLRLRRGSPAIDKGYNGYVTGVTTDVDGNPRIMNGQVDLGAYEFQYPALTINSFRAVWNLSEVQLNWSVVLQADVLGFSIHRASSPEGTREQVNAVLIPVVSGQQSYALVDTQAQFGQKTYYWLEIVRGDGPEMAGPIYAEYPVFMPLVSNE